MRKVVTLLPMKRISERVTNKNLNFFNGNPLYHIIMNTILKSKYIDLVLVNTDSEFLKLDILLNFKERFKVSDRNNEIYGNYVPMNKVLEQDISSVNSEIYIQTHTPNPLLMNSKKIVMIIKGEEKKKVLIDSLKKKFPVSVLIPKLDIILN